MNANPSGMGGRFELIEGCIFHDDGEDVIALSPTDGFLSVKSFREERSRLLSLLARLKASKLDGKPTHFGTEEDQRLVAELMSIGCVRNSDEHTPTAAKPAPIGPALQPTHQTVTINLDAPHALISLQQHLELSDLFRRIGHARVRPTVVLRLNVVDPGPAEFPADSVIKSLLSEADRHSIRIRLECDIDGPVQLDMDNALSFIDSHCQSRCYLSDSSEFDQPLNREATLARSHQLARDLTRMGFSCLGVIKTTTANDLSKRAAEWLNVVDGEGLCLEAVFVRNKGAAAGRDGPQTIEDLSGLMQASVELPGMIGKSVIHCHPWRDILLTAALGQRARAGWSVTGSQAYLSRYGQWSRAAVHASYNVTSQISALLPWLAEDPKTDIEYRRGDFQAEDSASSSRPGCAECDVRILCARYWSVHGDVASALNMDRHAAWAAKYQCNLRLNLLPQVLAILHDETRRGGGNQHRPQVRVRLEAGEVRLEALESS